MKQRKGTPRRRFLNFFRPAPASVTAHWQGMESMEERVMMYGVPVGPSQATLAASGLIPTAELIVSSLLPTNAQGFYVTNDGGADVTVNTVDPAIDQVLINGEPAFDLGNGAWQLNILGGGSVNDLLMPSGSVWKYLDTGVDLGTTWRGVFDDSLWASGPARLGFGGDGEVTTVGFIDTDPGTSGVQKNATTYFRSTFTASNVGQYQTLNLGLMRDDGAAVFLNGVEIARSNLAANAAYNTFAPTSIGGADEDTFNPFTIDLNTLPPDTLKEGLNILAVEVHQVNNTSSDLSFDLRLSASSPPTSLGSLNPGVNRVLIQAMDEDGQEIGRTRMPILYNIAPTNTLSGTLASNTVLTAAGSPYLVTSEVTVPAGVTLTIEPGTTIYFEAGDGMTVLGRLVAQGTDLQRISMKPQAGSTSRWGGVAFDASLNDSLMAYIDMEYADSDGHSIEADHSQLIIDNLTWSGTNNTAVEVFHPSVIIRNSIIPGINGSEVVHGQYIENNEYFIIENNVFGPATGGGDVVDFLGAARPGPVFQVRNNIFLGGSDDGLDLDGTDSLIEGNIFTDFHLRPDNTRQTTSNAIATGLPQSGEANRTEIVVTRNLFFNVDHAVLLKEDAFLKAYNNTFVDVSIAVIQFNEIGGTAVGGPGKGADLEGNIFRNIAAPFQNVQPQTLITLNRNIIDAAFHSYGSGNIDADPLFRDPAGLDYSLRPGSPAIGTGPNGADMGAIVPGGAVISGEPGVTFTTPGGVTTRKTASVSATLTIDMPANPNILSYSPVYQWRLNGGAWSAETPLATPIQLNNLLNGDYTVEVIGKNAANVWQTVPTVSKTWTVDASLSRAMLSEVLASNQSISFGGGTGDLIELYNDGVLPYDLSGRSISDTLTNPTRHVFAPGTILPAGGRMVLVADNVSATPGHVNFSLSEDGEGVFLFDTVANGSALLDSVQFGFQLVDRSISRSLQTSRWDLSDPTFGQPNQITPARDAGAVKVNEILATGQVRFEFDFVELYNDHAMAANFGGTYLSDNPDGNPDKHQFPPLSFLAGHGIMAFIADNDAPAGNDHLGFSLSPTESVGLFDGDLTEIDRLVPFETPGIDVSLGRSPDGSLFVGPMAPPTPNIPNPGILTQVDVQQDIIMDRGAVWKYLDDGSDQGTAWRAPGYDDSTWASGPAKLGYGGDGEVTTVGFIDTNPGTSGIQKNATTYFRSTFTVADLDGFDTLVVRLQRDDGAAVYLNGLLIVRDNLPVNAAYNTFASSTTDNANETTFFEFTFDIASLPAGALLEGLNHVAAEVHQANATSSDLGFDLELEITGTTSTEIEINPLPANTLNLLDNLRITEIMYNPAGNALAEFIELRNTGDESISLLGVRFTSGVDFTFPGINLAPGQFVVVVADQAAFTAAHGVIPGLTIAGQYSGSLSNAGEKIRLVTPGPLGAGIVSFTYADSWHPSTDGGGSSLVLLDDGSSIYLDGDAASWGPSLLSGGSPGAVEPTGIPGDFNFSGIVDATDINLIFDAVNASSTSPLYDLTGDSLVNSADIDHLVLVILNTFYGDANLDQRVSIGDLTILAESFGASGGWADGDFNGSGTVTIGDLTLMAENFGRDNNPPLIGDESAAAGSPLIGFDDSDDSDSDTPGWLHIDDVLAELAGEQA